MDAASLIESFLPEAANLNLGALGIEIEMLLRSDIGDRHSKLGREFNDLIYRVDFVDGSDTSINRTGYTRDVYYSKFETANVTECEWSLLAPRLQRFLAWLRREDEVQVTRDSSLTHDLVRAVGDNTLADPDNWKTVRLPRAKLPNNASAATHLHFDIHDWFDSQEHAAAFVHHFNKVGPEEFKPAIPAPRYGSVGRGNQHAKFDELPAPKQGLNPLYRKAVQAAFYSTAMGDRKRALNCHAALKRGDVEFRFVHATLSFNTISGWFQAIAELIEFSRLKAGGTGPDTFKDYLAAEAPDTLGFLNDRTERSARAAQEEPSLYDPYRPSRAVDRLAKSLVINPRRGFQGLT